MSDADGKTDAPHISFVVPHRGRHDLLRATLRSIARQRRPNDAVQSLEVLVMTQDDSPTAVREVLCDELSGAYAMSWQCVDAHDVATIAAVRNAGARLARGELLAFLDADVELAVDWVAVMLDELARDPRRVLVSAVQSPSATSGAVERIRSEASLMRADREVDSLPGANLLVGRAAFEQVDGFPEHLETCEDIVFTERLGQLGELYLSGATSFVHLGEDTGARELFQKEFWRARSNLRSLIGRRIGLAEVPSLVVPPLVAAASVGVPLALFAGARMFALALALLVAVPVLAYSLRLYLAARGRLHLSSLLGFYGTYFFARGLGMFASLGDRPHDRAVGRS